METSKFSNGAIARLLREIIAVYEIRGEDRFKIRAYDNAATSVEHATEEVRDLWEEGRLKDLPGVGSAIAGHLREFFEKGHVKHFDEVKKGIPAAMFPLLAIPGIGAKTAYFLAQELKLKEKSAVADLLKAAKSGKIRVLPGFGETSEGSIIENLEKVRKNDNRITLPVASELAERILLYLRQNPRVIQAEALGSLRRRAATVGDIDIAVSTNHPEEVVEYFTKFPEVAEVLNEGGLKGRIILRNSRQVDLMTQKPKAFGALLQHFTGSKNHNIHLREVAKSMNLSLSEYGIKGKSGQISQPVTEKDFYSRLSMSYIEPELREDSGEIEAALKGKLPDLVTNSDLKGDLQMHTVWSDGENTIEEMVTAAKNLGHFYIGITDHQMSLEKYGSERIITEIRRRKSIIDKINYSNKNIRVLNGIELLIRADGELSYPNEMLKEFDYVMVAIHTGFNQEKNLITKRLIQALENPFVKILAHPTARLLGQRESVSADWEEVFKVCALGNKILEIDAFPDRLDLPDILVKTAKTFGIKFSIDSDAHATSHLNLLKYGVDVARRGWLTKDDVVNTYPLPHLEKILGIRR